MALDLGTVLAIIEIADKAIEIYKRIDGLPQQMSQLGRRLTKLNIFLVRLEVFIKTKPVTASASLYPGQQQDLGKLLDSIKENVTKVHDLFERYEKGILSRSMDLEFRAKWISNIWFSLIDNSPEKIQLIMEEIDYDRSVLSDYMAIMAIDRPQRPPAAGRKPNTTSKAAGAARPAKPAGSPVRSRQDYKVLFVDPYNTERSVVAESLLKLFGERTKNLTTNGGPDPDWRISEVQSAGFFVKAGSDCVDVIDNLQYSFASFKKDWRPGGQKPVGTALAAVFDNQWYDYPFKRAVWDEASGRTSRGLRKDMFARFDFIFVFTRREHDNMVKLKEALGKTAVAPRGKGRVLHLGAFLAQGAGGGSKEILYPKTNPDGSQIRSNWWVLYLLRLSSVGRLESSRNNSAGSRDCRFSLVA
jgi:protein-tyrosine-phosphatase